MASTSSLPSTPRVNIGALTTTFTPQGGCDVLQIVSSGLRPGFFALRPGSRCVVTMTTRQSFFAAESCFPGVLGAFLNGAEGYGTTRPVYSPGSVCPAGYLPAYIVSRTPESPAPTTTPGLISTNIDLWNLLFEGETATGCCPRWVRTTSSTDDTGLCIVRSRVRFGPALTLHF
ncbi:hypothetical protein C8A03DRAFT_19706 [Achaetomium macrosporum]|uniref:Uncharacterized protein n=1 Tax=Achaetomium macrosporum TaxID=79813 RepID=A0AAN7H6G3_9PEZI|nr:hypothetical protein C8A03DRAFT_19706 [Achaetomium macrosporum]